MLLNSASIALILTWLVVQSSYAYMYSVNYGSTACLSLTIGENTSRFVHNYLSKDIDGATLTLSLTYLLQETHTVKAFMRKHVRCLTVLVSHVDNLMLVINLTKSVEEHMIVYSGKIMPPKDLLKVAERPIAILLEVSWALLIGLVFLLYVILHIHRTLKS